MNMLGVGLLLMLFSSVTSTYNPGEEADCDLFYDCEKFGTSDKGYCQATCNTEQENGQFLCLCTQATGNSAFTCSLNCTADQKDTDEDLTLERCKTICSDVSGCNAFAYTDKNHQHEDRAECSLWKECYKPISQGDQTTYKKCDIPREEELCPQLTPAYGPTVLHWTCKDQSNNDISPYYDEDKEKLVEDVKCTPLPSGISCETDTFSEISDSSKASLTCTNNGNAMEWKLQVENSDIDTDITTDKFDIVCKCPTQNVKAGFGTELICNTPVTQNNGKYTLEDPNTCILLCDGIFVASITCEIGENEAGTAKEIHWIYTYEELDGTIVEIVQDPINKKCISCFQSDLDENCEE